MSQPGYVYPSPSLPQSIRRTSAPAAGLADPRTSWMDSRLRSQSLSSSSNSSPGVETPSCCGIDRLTIGDLAYTAVVDTFRLIHQTAFDNIIPLAVHPTATPHAW